MKLPLRNIPLLLSALTLAAFTAIPLRAEIRAGAWGVCREKITDIGDVSRCASWEPAELPVIVKAGGDTEGELSSIWLRSTLEVDGDFSGYRGITTGRAGPNVSLYLNGRCAVKGSLNASTYLPLPGHYLLTEGFLHQGNNEIILRIDGYTGHHMTLNGPVVLQDEREFELTKFIHDFFYIYFPFGIAFVCLAFAAALLLYYFLTRRQPILIFSSLALLLLTATITLNYLPFALLPYGLCFALEWAIQPLLFALLIMIVQSIYRTYFYLFNAVTVTLLAAASPLIFFANGTLFGLPLRPVMATTIFIFILPIFSMLLRRLDTLQKNRLRLIISILCLGTASLLSAVEIIFEVAGWSASALILIYCAPLFIAIFAVLFGRERMLRNREIDVLYQGLSQSREPTITESSEEKLKRVIEFIDANYHSDISREGLAAAVGLNANYMGSLFKTYTGRRISEYIHESRIREAADRLRQGDEKVITIALSVGFESLATFNRAFKAQMGVTPSDYRAGKS